jgi:hypothetical protein
MSVTKVPADGSGGGGGTPNDGTVTDVKVAAGAAISADKLADGSTLKVMTAAERTKLAGVATGATAYTDEQVDDRVNTLIGGGTHTGISWAYNDTSGTLSATVTAGGSSITQNLQTGTSYTVVLADAGKVVEMSNASANTLTVPPDASVPYPVGTYFHVRQGGAGQTTIAPGSGVTLSSRGGALKLVGQWSEATLTKRATDQWVVTGEVTI